ncbi:MULTISPECIES: type III secretion inner membrane ring lipoprotein SctJ [unclassified Bradyrhizobium]|uniref:type III secretion system inner membrane ring lipoprotein SctJ n=1 Tax=unclassified Bradyrhizobium TaxID=2631580 RepID=UPI001FF89AFA|nr:MULTISPECIES: type III secretion inner membrane ring lipoprotein SctJ [unclassified Bradyrhizobium]MCK1316899.1 type III secretion inner membrane ring lipoprotein SctJ [Bradyrhizobium sp. 23]MCK1410340.1 type III secretion inner membrane ring lipoprotein SctJ [Bradyrhizobium sp. 76]MCK1478384.1 type III secretion inner membrane ring lipoprotein SctJ [Bradyrhizobium sp. 197]MCK1486696.1 type III secretion inner membrane ring lipoprotein SctJ [Bradyrhizobium sp. 193]MCK1535828.1 type III secr
MIGLIDRESDQARPFRKRLQLVALLPLLLALVGCKADLYTKVQEREANEMLAVLLKNGVDALRVAAKDGTITIQVEQTQIASAIDLLNGEGLPRHAFKSLGEVFSAAGLIASPIEERARYVYALSEELSRTISDIDGVLSARVHVVLPKNDLLRRDTTPSSASVFIRHDSRANLSILLPQIKMLVANSIEGLSYDKVAVVFVSVERPALEPRPAAAAGLAQASGVISTPLVAVGMGLGGSVFGVLSCVLLSARGRQRRQSSQKVSAVGGRSAVSAMEMIRKAIKPNAA